MAESLQNGNPAGSPRPAKRERGAWVERQRSPSAQSRSDETRTSLTREIRAKPRFRAGARNRRSQLAIISWVFRSTVTLSIRDWAILPWPTTW
jgi:hypothetical protein